MPGCRPRDGTVGRARPWCRERPSVDRYSRAVGRSGRPPRRRLRPRMRVDHRSRAGARAEPDTVAGGGRRGRGAGRDDRSGRGGHSRCRLRRRLRGRRRGRYWRRSRITRGEQGERVDVPVRVGHPANAEVEIRPRILRFAAAVERPDGLAFGDGRATRHRHDAEVEQRDCVTVRCLQRHRATVYWQRAGEAHDARGRCGHGVAGAASDVDATVLAALVRARPRVERSQDGACRRPAPRAGRGAERKCRDCEE